MKLNNPLKADNQLVVGCVIFFLFIAAGGLIAAITVTLIYLGFPPVLAFFSSFAILAGLRTLRYVFTGK